MPYIKKIDRLKWNIIIHETIETLKLEDEKKWEGELNYMMTAILKRLYKPSYYNYNKVIGLLECIKLEYYRRIISLYENEKKRMEGDIK